MHSILVVCVLLAASWMPINSMSDKEIDMIKGLVDKELAARESELLKQKKTVADAKQKKSVVDEKPETRHNEIVHPLGPKTTKATPVVTTSKPTQRTTLHPDTNLQHSIDNCIDMIPSDKCAKIIEAGEDCSREDMMLHCERSCGYCAQPSYPVDCSKSEYGCCDDMRTPKKNPFGKGCPVCRDRVPELCKPYPHDCNEVGMVGNWMRVNCEKTCGVCVPTLPYKAKVKIECTDDKESGKYCESWKNARLCTFLPTMMKKYCTKTCGYCKQFEENKKAVKVGN